MAWSGRIDLCGGDGDALVHHVETVAHRTQAHRTEGDRLAPVLDRQADVGHAGGQQYGQRTNLGDLAVRCVFRHVVRDEMAVLDA
jgi:hypothetical protein